MPTLHDLIPDPQSVLALEPEELAGLALEQHDAAMAMEMHRIVEEHSEKIVKELDRVGLDLDSHSPRKRVEAFRTLGTLEKGFFSGMREAIEKLER